MATQRAELSIGQASVGTFNVSAVPQAHELDIRFNPRGVANGRYSVPEMIQLPGEIGMVSAVEPVACDDKSSDAGRRIEPLHDVRPQRGPVPVVQWEID